MMANTSSIRFKYASPGRYGILKVFARENRAKATLAENILWDRVRNKKLGVEIRRQHIIYDYIADFVCLDKMLVIEVDGAYHAEISQQEDDAARTENLNSIGFTVIRFTNEDVIYNTEKVIQVIESHIHENRKNNIPLSSERG